MRVILGNDSIRDTTDVKVRLHNLSAAPREVYDIIEATGWFKLYRSTLSLCALERHFQAVDSVTTISDLEPGLPKTDVVLEMASDMASRVAAFHAVFDLLRSSNAPGIVVHSAMQAGAQMFYRFPGEFRGVHGGGVDIDDEPSEWIGIPSLDVIVYFGKNSDRLTRTGTGTGTAQFDRIMESPVPEVGGAGG